MTNMLSKKRIGEIEAEVRNLQITLWRQCPELLKGPRALALLEPGVALGLYGFSIESVDSLGEMDVNGRRYEVAGIMNRDSKCVQISSRVLPPVQKFTAAHELGHVALKHVGMSLHRDIPLGDAGPVRDPQEAEANRFASCFLIPAKQLRIEFAARFGSEIFELDEATCFWLCGKNIDAVRQRYRSLRQLTLHLAGETSFDGKHFDSLSTLFGVSAKTMAIRLEELGLVSDRWLK